MKKLLLIMLFAFAGICSFANASNPIFPISPKIFVGANLLKITTKDAMDKLLESSLKDPVQAEKINELLERIKAEGKSNTVCVGQWNDQNDICVKMKPTKRSLCSFDTPKEFKFTIVCHYFFAYNCSTFQILFWTSNDC
jgi:hypothetical protein